jgi:hypothetical protein
MAAAEPPETNAKILQAVLFGSGPSRGGAHAVSCLDENNSTFPRHFDYSSQPGRFWGVLRVRETMPRQ